MITVEEVRQRLATVARDVFDSESIELTDDTVAKDVEGWDSLTHVDFIVAVEREFKVKFTTREVHSFPNIGALVQLIVSKVG